MRKLMVGIAIAVASIALAVTSPAGTAGTAATGTPPAPNFLCC